MSEASQIPLAELPDWLRRETEPIFEPTRKKAQSLLSEMRQMLENLEEVCRMLLENSEKEIEKRNKKTYGRARALNKLARLFLERLRQIEVPGEINYNKLSNSFKELQKAFTVTEVDMRNWFPRISPFFIMDRRKFQGSFENAQEFVKELQKLLSTEFAGAEVLDETYQRIKELEALTEERGRLESKRNEIVSRQDLIEKTVAGTQHRISSLKDRESLSQIGEAEMEIEKLRRKAKQNFSHLRKPFIKMRRLVSHKGGLSPEEFGKLDRYIKDPFDGLATEETGYPILKVLLQKLSRLISENQIKLKHDRRRKAESDIDIILNKDFLADLQENSILISQQREQLSASPETRSIFETLSELQGNLRKLRRRLQLIEIEGDTVKQRLEETTKRLQDTKTAIEENVLNLVSQKIQIQLEA